MRDDDRLHPRPCRPHPGASHRLQEPVAGRGRARLFAKIGCADCHSEKLGPIAGIYSDMLLHDMGVELESSTGYYGSIIPQPAVRNDKFAVSEQPTPAEWRTAPLWGVADSGPYLHDGRAGSLEQAIELHGGEASDVAVRFKEMSIADRNAMVAFPKTLRPPRPRKNRRPLRRGDHELVADVTILVCACGMRLKAAGAVPGRVGKCPGCGGSAPGPGRQAPCGNGPRT